jgi:hypothetical protein
MTTKARKAEIEEIFKRLSQYPQIALIQAKTPCDGYRYSSMPLRAYGDPTLKETYRCKRNARLHFAARKPVDPWEFPTRSGNFCWQHFSDNLHGSHSESERFNSWWSRLNSPNEEWIRISV